MFLPDNIQNRIYISIWAKPLRNFVFFRDASLPSIPLRPLAHTRDQQSDFGKKNISSVNHDQESIYL